MKKNTLKKQRQVHKKKARRARILKNSGKGTRAQHKDREPAVGGLFR